VNLAVRMSEGVRAPVGNQATWAEVVDQVGAVGLVGWVGRPIGPVGSPIVQGPELPPWASPEASQGKILAEG